MQRRQLLAGASALVSTAALGVIAGCAAAGSTANGAATVAVTLAGAQAEAQAILGAVESAVVVMGITVPAPVETALAAAQAAVGVFAGVPAGASGKQEAMAAVQAIAGIVALLALPPGTALAITAGLALVNGFVAGAPSVSIPASLVTNAPVGAVAGRVSAPIPIPFTSAVVTPISK